MLQFKQSVFAGFVTDASAAGPRTPPPSRAAWISWRWSRLLAPGHLVRQGRLIIIDGDARSDDVDPSPIILAEYGSKDRRTSSADGRRWAAACHARDACTDTEGPATANIEKRLKTPGAVPKWSVVGVGPFRSEFLFFMGRKGDPPGEEEQYQAYKKAARARSLLKYDRSAPRQDVGAGQGSSTTRR
jgi:phosphotransferase system enzyme I (PtsI)